MLFSKAEPTTLEHLAETMVSEQFEEGGELFNDGDTFGKAYLVLEGVVGIYRDGLIMARYKPGGFFGEFSMIDGQSYSASAKAETDVVVASLESNDFYRMVEENHDLAKCVIQDLGRRLKRHL